MRKLTRNILGRFFIWLAWKTLPAGNLKNELAIWVAYYLAPENETDGLTLDEEINRRKEQIAKEENSIMDDPGQNFLDLPQ